MSGGDGFMTDDGERERLAALRAYRILDTEPEEAFDDLVMLASQNSETPVALISLIDSDRQWFKARSGMTVQETARNVAFCAHAIRETGIFQVEDALADERFKDNPLVVTDPHIRFYTGAPLVTPEGHAIGTICVIDRKPKRLEPDQLEALQAIQRQVVAQLELRKSLLDLKDALAERDRAQVERERLIADLHGALENVRHLSALIPACSTCLVDVTIPADVSRVAAVRDGVVQLLREKGAGRGQEIDVAVALQEALVNAIKHGCGNDPSKSVQCCVTIDEAGEVLIVVRDPGAGFEVAAVPSPLSASGLLRHSGRGVFLINELMDEVRYEDGGRELRMRKRVAAPPARPPADH
jgi:anti-sigma regulatory factor (Ser/Thr protein kinase)